MGKSNPSARGYAIPTGVSTPITNRPTFGGNSKAGTTPTVGLGWFASNATQLRASTVAGHFLLQLVGYTISNSSTTNQIGGIGRPRWGMFNPSADGVNTVRRRAAQD